MKTALGIGGFPIELTLNSNVAKPIPSVEFDTEKKTGSTGDLFNEEIKIYVTPTDYFKTKFREIFTDTVISHKSGKESRKWLTSPNMSFWPQQLNFALLNFENCIRASEIISFVSYLLYNKENYSIQFKLDEYKVKLLCQEIQLLVK